MNREKLQQQLQELEEKAKQIREELNKPDELQPFDYTTLQGKGYYIQETGNLYYNPCGHHPTTRYAACKKGAEILAKQHRWQVLMQSLRDSLGCGDYVFIPGESNFEVYYCTEDSRWKITSGTRMRYYGIFYFPTEEDAQKVVDYLNNHYPDGFK